MNLLNLHDSSLNDAIVLGILNPYAESTFWSKLVLAIFECLRGHEMYASETLTESDDRARRRSCDAGGQRLERPEEVARRLESVRVSPRAIHQTCRAGIDGCETQGSEEQLAGNIRTYSRWSLEQPEHGREGRWREYT